MDDVVGHRSSPRTNVDSVSEVSVVEVDEMDGEGVLFLVSSSSSTFSSTHSGILSESFPNIYSVDPLSERRCSDDSECCIFVSYILFFILSSFFFSASLSALLHCSSGDISIVTISNAFGSFLTVSSTITSNSSVLLFCFLHRTTNITNAIKSMTTITMHTINIHENFSSFPPSTALSSPFALGTLLFFRMKESVEEGRSASPNRMHTLTSISSPQLLTRSFATLPSASVSDRNPSGSKLCFSISFSSPLLFTTAKDRLQGARSSPLNVRAMASGVWLACTLWSTGTKSGEGW
ncbi:uncharacterized protein MONOS_16585 [Monocercomonoides exilis]|uniref:uncharacterized protein n=1 Tax=Monocercomonoides exilis TaxID=2049356 RepID=UPI003559E256|nr:hypothetical protein MONOS_16585 [Monocercomonoides exilis]|eukprot:MONOS_16585.1-p1 / transcript=MONOS_16585.1 / gene=MONOS_16585 / organism=Monocercomonoides_exilis_PA203 / gene_product=unspecified product / transcript_product=unspecified product / location=Mono_scaffold01883:2440-3318(-) / protein_length=293 / sequence_SO=supercontig / SO=protein_coding / is_pseudo=false